MIQTLDVEETLLQLTICKEAVCLAILALSSMQKKPISKAFQHSRIVAENHSSHSEKFQHQP